MQSLQVNDFELENITNVYLAGMIKETGSAVIVRPE